MWVDYRVNVRSMLMFHWQLYIICTSNACDYPPKVCDYPPKEQQNQPKQAQTTQKRTELSRLYVKVPRNTNNRRVSVYDGLLFSVV